MQPRRERLQAWRPEWNLPIERWTAKFINKNRWRCDSILDFDDLMQDAYLTFVKVKQTYPRVNNPAHFMALYKTTIINEMTNRARYRQTKQQVVTDLDDGLRDYLAERIEGDDNDGYLQILLSELPTDLKLALRILASNKSETLNEIRPKTRLQRMAGIDLDDEEKLNARLCWALGFRKVINLIGQLRDALSGKLEYNK